MALITSGCDQRDVASADGDGALFIPSPGAHGDHHLGRSKLFTVFLEPLHVPTAPTFYRCCISHGIDFQSERRLQRACPRIDRRPNMIRRLRLRRRVLLVGHNDDHHWVWRHQPKDKRRDLVHNLR